MEIENAGTILKVMCGLGFVLVFGGFALDLVEVRRLRPQEPTRPIGDLMSPRRLFAKRLVVAGTWWIAAWLAAAALWLFLSIQ
jgi:hypothetical protein